MIRFQIIYWRDIPAQVKVKAGRQRAARPLADRFQQAIDRAAMRARKTDASAYLEEWRNGEWQESEGLLDALLTAKVAELEAVYSDEKLAALVNNKGWEADGGSG